MSNKKGSGVWGDVMNKWKVWDTRASGVFKQVQKSYKTSAEVF